MFLFYTWILGTDEQTSWTNPVDSFCQGLVGACGVSVLCSLMRVYYFIQTCSDSESKPGSKTSSKSQSWIAGLQFWTLAFILSLVGSRVSSLIVLEFSLRAVSAWASSGLDSGCRGPDLLLVQSQFSLGCGLACTLVFLHQGALHSSLSSLLAAALSWGLASVGRSLWAHVATLFPLHSTERYCGKCISLLTSGHSILASLQRAVVLVFALATAVSMATVYDHFLSEKDALKLWAPLTLCYTMLVFYVQEGQTRQPGAEALLHTVVLRLGALLVLMLTVGDWSDVLHVFVAFLGEAVCLLPSQDLLQAALQEEEETNANKLSHTRRRRESREQSSTDDR